MLNEKKSGDTAALRNDPRESVKKLGKVSVSGAAFRRDGQTYVTLGEFNANFGYSAGAIPLPASVTLKRLTADVKRFNALPALRPEYRISTLELKNSIVRLQQDYSCKSDLVIEADNLFMIRTTIGFSFPRESGGRAGFAFLPDGEDIKLTSLALAYTDKSFFDHVFELARRQGGSGGTAQ